ncbi:MAG TPA: PUA domain-containing protein, partial [Kineosporiaceae bacterium]|nr:PUA domain-containing protein [Kineosporiaceae bacterium]
AHAARTEGRLVLDDGAVAAVVGRGTSLLPAGVTRIEGGFSAGDPVELVDGAGRVVAKGLVNYDAAELPALLGRSTRDLARELGADHSRELVHRDDLVLVDIRVDRPGRVG